MKENIVKINLNNSDEFTQDNVARLIGSVLDSKNWQLRVTLGGIAYLSELVGNREIEGLAFRFETWCQGNNCVGFQAEHDEKWVGRVFQALKANWPSPTSTFIDNF